MRINRFKLAKVLLPLMLIIAIASTACVPSSSPIAAPTGTNMPTETTSPTIKPTATATITPTATVKPTLEPPVTASPTETPQLTPIPFKPTDKITIVVEGNSTDISWESDPGCVLTIRETGAGPGDPGNFNISSGLCTPEMVTLLLEGIKKTTTSATPEWQIQTLDEAINELKQYE